MKCPKCGAVLPDNAKFCGMCGQAFYQGQQQGQNSNQQFQQRQYNQQQGQNTNPQYQNQRSTDDVSSVDRRILVNPSEKIIAAMSSSMVLTFFTGGGLGKTEMFFTNARFYAKFREFSVSRGISNMDAIVDLEHVTGTVLMQNNPIGFIVGAVILFLTGIVGAASSGEGIFILPMWMLSGICVFLYFLKRAIRLKIAYEGDAIVVPMRGCSYASADKFHKQLRNYLDRIKK